MKYLLLVCLTFALFSCREDADCKNLRLGDKFRLNDGAVGKLVGIYDQRCPCDAVCIWQGYIGLTITIGNDTILGRGAVFGALPAFETNDLVYQSIRGDRIILANVGEPAGACVGSVAGEEFCLELIVE